MEKLRRLDLFEPKFESWNTIIYVDNLFKNHLLRKKQLETSTKRLRNLIRQFEILSLIHFEIELILEDFDHKILFSSNKAVSLHEKFIGFCDNQKYIQTHDYEEIGTKILGFINSCYTYNINLKASKRLQFIIINNKFVPNKELYELVSKELSSCQKFNLMNIDTNNFVYCLSITCSFSNYSIIAANKSYEFKFHSNEMKHVLRNFVESFLVKFDYRKEKKKALDHSEPMRPSKISKHDFEIYADDLKATRISKIVKKPITCRLVQQDTCNLVRQIDSHRMTSFCRKKSKNKIQLHIKSLPNFDKKNIVNAKLNYSSLETRVQSYSQNLFKNTLNKIKNKSTQTKAVKKGY